MPTLYLPSLIQRLGVFALLTLAPATHAENTAPVLPPLRVGDVVFIHVSAYPFERISEVTQSWVNHVGIVVDASAEHPQVAESTFPRSRLSPLSQFIARSAHGQFAIKRLQQPLDAAAEARIQHSSQQRLGQWYGTGFGLDSSRPFCSRFVYEVLHEAVGVEVGKIETFADLLRNNPKVAQGFWRWWFLGSIPWQRQTITPASVYQSPLLIPVFESTVAEGVSTPAS